MPYKADDAKSPDLDKLAEKVRRDPATKLFFPLAEEYLKVGLVDDAIDVLRQGIKVHPEFLSARVALGKALLQKGLQPEAQAELEQVIAANPDNIMAHKKLGWIYLQTGKKELARASCESVLAIHPADSEMLHILDQVNRLPDSFPVVEGEVYREPTRTDKIEVEPTLVNAMHDGTAVDDEPTTTDASFEEPTVVGMIEVQSTEVSHDRTKVVDDDCLEIDRVPQLNASRVKEASDDVETISLADLYVVQGHYDRAIRIYQRILQRIPDHADAAAKLENAVTLSRLLTPQGPVGDALEEEVLDRALGRLDSALNPDGEQGDPVAMFVATGGGSSARAAVIDRLEAWLAHIQRKRRT